MLASPLHDHLAFLFRFDAWANRAVAEALTTALGEADDASPKAGALGDATRLFAHLTRASEVWLGRVQRTEAARLPIWPEGPDEAGVAVSGARAAQTAAAWRCHLHEAAVADLQRGIRYENSRGEPFETPLAEIAAHVVNHGSHHRGQIARLLREAGLQPPALDLIAYARSQERRLRDLGLPVG